MTKVTIELEDEQIDAIVVSSLKYIYDSFDIDIKKVKMEKLLYAFDIHTQKTLMVQKT